MARNKLKLIVCGGAGAKIIGKQEEHIVDGVKVKQNAKAYLNNLLSNIINLEVIHLDTDDKSNRFDSDEFYHIKEEKLSGSIGDGGAGGIATEKKDLIEVSVANLAPKLVKDEPNTIFLILSSATGGSGRMISLYLTKYFMQMDVSFIPIVVLDTTEEEHTNNSIKTLKTFRVFAKQANKALNILWKDNIDGVSNVDSAIIGFISALGIFTSEYNQDIEISDMKNFFRMDKYNLSTIPNGLYYTNIKYGNDIISALKENNNIALARILSNDPTLDKTNISKRTDVGSTTDITDAVVNELDIHLPLALYSESGLYTKKVKDMEARYEELKKGIQEEEVPDVDSEDGFIL